MTRQGGEQRDAALRSVLIVEDDPHIRRLIDTVLGDAGYDCTQAADPQAGGALLEQQTFDVLVCDINLPGESGVEFVRRMRPEHQDLAVLMVTAVDDPAIAATALESGADGYLTKPFRANDIVIGVLNVLRQRSVARERTRLEQASLHDPLTGLPERRLVPRMLADALERAATDGDDVTVLIFDIDRFSLINAALGGETGDLVLREVAARLRDATGSDDAIARLGPDEFLLIDVQAHLLVTGPTLADRAVAALADRVVTSAGAISTTASVGVAVAHAGAGRPETLLRHAEIALRRAKEMGGNRVCHFEMTLQERWSQRLDAEMQLRRAIEQEQFRLYYQPIVRLQDGVLKGLEALLRWEHPDDGIVAPGRFIPIAEETGLIVDLGAWVIEEACRQIGEWTDAAGAERLPTVSVNVSPRQFAEPDFISRVEDTLRRTGVEPGRLAFEITERQLVDGASAAGALQATRELGIPLMLDDFGTGYSSLGHLKRFPVGALKVDRMFVAGLPGDASNLALIHAILAMAGSLGIDVIAEGIETHEQAHLLRSIECGSGQGYLLARPMPVPPVTKLLREGVDWLEILMPDDPGPPVSSAVEHDSLTGRLLAAEGPGSRPAFSGSEGRLLRPAEAAAALDVSLSTLRRWADTGQIPMIRTDGGHRRFSADDIRVFKQQARVDPPAIHAVLPPAQPLPGVAKLLAERRDELLTASMRRLYAGPTPGWFAAADARPLVWRWMESLVGGCRSGGYAAALTGTRTLMQHAYVHGATLLERHRFIESFRDTVVTQLTRHSAAREELVGARRLFAALGQSILEE